MKLLGLCLLLVTAVGLSFRYAREMKRTLDTWVACEDFIRYTKMQIDCFCTPKNRIFSSFSHKVLEARGFLPALRIGKEMGMAAEETLGDRELVGLLSQFGRELGQGYREEQMAVCDFYLAALRTKLEDLQRAFPSKVRVRRTVYISGAMLLALLFL